MNPSDVGPHINKVHHKKWKGPWKRFFLMRINFASRGVEIDGYANGHSEEKHASY